MAKFTAEQAISVLAIQQVIHEWSHELDQNSGLKISEADVLTEDCRYFIADAWQEGRAAAAKYYADRWARLGNGKDAPVMRHLHSNYRVSFNDADNATVGFSLLFFAGVGEPPMVGHCDALAVAEVWMECRREADGHWRISEFNSRQTFRRG